MNNETDIQALTVICGILLGHVAKQHELDLEEMHHRICSNILNNTPDETFSARFVAKMDSVFLIAKHEKEAH